MKYTHVDTPTLYTLARKADMQKVWQKNQDRKADEKINRRMIENTDNGIDTPQIDATNSELHILEEDIGGIETRLRYYPNDTKAQTMLKRLYHHHAALLRKKDSNIQGAASPSQHGFSLLDEAIASLSTKMFRILFAPVNTPLEQLRQIQLREYRAQQKDQGKSSTTFRSFPVAVKSLFLSPMELVASIEQRRKTC